VIDLLTRRATALNLPIATPASLKTKLSRWENGKEQPSETYQRLFREIYGRTNTELGFPDEPEEDPEATELRARLAVARTVDRETVEIFRHQVDHARHLDRRFGASPNSTHSAPRSTTYSNSSPTALDRNGPHWPESSRRHPRSPDGKPSTALRLAKPGPTTNAPKPPPTKPTPPPYSPTPPPNKPSSSSTSTNPPPPSTNSPTPAASPTAPPHPC
jgi:hypothetical protein